MEWRAFALARGQEGAEELVRRAEVEEEEEVQMIGQDCWVDNFMV